MFMDPYSPLELEDTCPYTPGAWTLAVLPDTQFYADSRNRSKIWFTMMDWLISERERRNIRMMVHVGDLVNRNLHGQWEVAREAMKRIRGQVPAMVTTGNHDIGVKAVGSDRSTLLNEYISHRDLAPLYGGFVEGRAENNFTCFNAIGESFLVMTLEFGPRDAVVAWADDVLSRHPNHRVLLVTHEYIDHESGMRRPDGFSLHSTADTENSPYQYGISSLPGGVNTGRDLWEKLVKPHSNVEMVFNGHYKGVQQTENGDWERLDDIASGYRCDERPEGGRVHQLLFNAQWAPHGGNGWLRLLEFQPDGTTVRVHTVSPWLAKQGQAPWRTGPRHQFVLKRGRFRQKQPASFV